MNDPERLRAAILQRLASVIDPETGVDVVRMRLIEDLTVDENGRVSYKFRPSSPLCPIAVPLAWEIQQAVAQVEGVTEQDCQIVGYIQASGRVYRIDQTGVGGKENRHSTFVSVCHCATASHRADRSFAQLRHSHRFRYSN
jgi:metal-sulfur cluster biosynthetic enzyme